MAYLEEIEINKAHFSGLSLDEKYEYFKNLFDGKEFKFTSYHKFSFHYEARFMTRLGLLTAHYRYEANSPDDLYGLSLSASERFFKQDFEEMFFHVVFNGDRYECWLSKCKKDVKAR